LTDSDNIRCRWQNHIETGECRFDCFDPVIDLRPAFAKLALDERIVTAVSGLYGERACLLKDKLIFKPPGATGYALHQDYISWDSFPESFVTAIVAIDAAEANNGATKVFPGYHKLGCISPRDGMYHTVRPLFQMICCGYRKPIRSKPSRTSRVNTEACHTYAIWRFGTNSNATDQSAHVSDGMLVLVCPLVRCFM
jgi:hypothetical protein